MQRSAIITHVRELYSSYSKMMTREVTIVICNIRCICFASYGSKLINFKRKKLTTVGLATPARQPLHPASPKAPYAPPDPFDPIFANQPNRSLSPSTDEGYPAPTVWLSDLSSGRWLISSKFKDQPGDCEETDVAENGLQFGSGGRPTDEP
ncbi:hypothetical protein PUN28_014241 [Cardiocondyla obscurior]|uniref:Uncharacterized protein n=1 Tax=Cardiocondyla obscurior TaxID=286306 RepID=A0AAW2F0D8_9HYME